MLLTISWIALVIWIELRTGIIAKKRRTLRSLPFKYLDFPAKLDITRSQFHPGSQTVRYYENSPNKLVSRLHEPQNGFQSWYFIKTSVVLFCFERRKMKVFATPVFCKHAFSTTATDLEEQWIRCTERPHSANWLNSSSTCHNVIVHSRRWLLSRRTAVVLVSGNSAHLSVLSARL